MSSQSAGRSRKETQPKNSTLMAVLMICAALLAILIATGQPFGGVGDVTSTVREDVGLPSTFATQEQLVSAESAIQRLGDPDAAELEAYHRGGQPPALNTLGDLVELATLVIRVGDPDTTELELYHVGR